MKMGDDDDGDENVIGYIHYRMLELNSQKPFYAWMLGCVSRIKDHAVPFELPTICPSTLIATYESICPIIPYNILQRTQFPVQRKTPPPAFLCTKIQ